jgi:hypothetical protein
MQYIELTSAANVFESKNLAIRPCYLHLLPQIHSDVDQDGLRRSSVTGTPGIGKSVFGAFLTRYFVRNVDSWSVVYWERDNVFLFSWDDHFKKKYGLKRFGTLPTGRTCYYGFWKSENKPLSGLLREDKVVMIHDPKEGERRVVIEHDVVRRVVFILSYGHDLFEFWGTKGFGPQAIYYCPLWTRAEAENAANLLFSDNETAVDIQKLFYKFGGCARAWANPDMLDTLKRKAEDVVKKNGDDLLKKTQDSKGSIVHLDVDFDETRPVRQYLHPIGSDAIAYQGSQTPPENKFDKFRFVFASPKVVEFVDDALMKRGNEAMELCFAQWTGQKGFESIYGALFELRCHRTLINRSDSLQLRMRYIHKCDSNNTPDIYKVTLPPPVQVTRFKSNNPAVLGEDTYRACLGAGAYLWPLSNNFPTYDSAMLVSGEVLQRKEQGTIALLLQMTVSGATGLPRRPNHVVKQHIRGLFDATFAKHIKTYSANSAVTAFVVPTECFQRFLFQPETTVDKGDQATVSQPDVQLVFEMPDIFSMPKGTMMRLTLDENAESRKRKHRYSEVTRAGNRNDVF